MKSYTTYLIQSLIYFYLKKKQGNTIFVFSGFMITNKSMILSDKL